MVPGFGDQVGVQVAHLDHDDVVGVKVQPGLLEFVGMAVLQVGVQHQDVDQGSLYPDGNGFADLAAHEDGVAVPLVRVAGRDDGPLDVHRGGPLVLPGPQVEGDLRTHGQAQELCVRPDVADAREEDLLFALPVFQHAAQQLRLLSHGAGAAVVAQVGDDGGPLSLRKGPDDGLLRRGEIPLEAEFAAQIPDGPRDALALGAAVSLVLRPVGHDDHRGSQLVVIVAQVSDVEAAGEHPRVLLSLIQHPVDGPHGLLRGQALLAAQQHGQLEDDGAHGAAVEHEVRKLAGDDLPAGDCVGVRGFAVAAHDVHRLGKGAGDVAVGVLHHRDGHVPAHQAAQPPDQHVLPGHLVQPVDAAGAVQLEIDGVDLMKVFLHPAQKLRGDRLERLPAEHARGARVGV